jgi:hypothetical protein
MTTVITRLYESVDMARDVAATLRAEGFPDATLDVITTADADRMEAARVDRRAAERYASAMAQGHALLVCRAPFTPFGAAARAQMVANATPSVDVGVANENVYIREVADLGRHEASVLAHHPLMMTRDDYVGSGWSGWRLSDVFGFTTVSRRRARPDNLSTGHKSTAFWPGKMLSTRPRRSSVISGGRHMSRGWWPMPLVRTGSKRSILKSHPLITPRFGWPIRTAQR